MADNKAYPGHDEGTNRPTNAGSEMLVGGSTFAPLADDTNSVNVKSDMGKAAGLVGK